jgi:hypothetical protein
MNEIVTLAKGSVASFHLRELPLYFSPDSEVEEEWHG